MSKLNLAPVGTSGSSRQGCSTNKGEVFLEISQNSHESTCARVCFLKRDSGTGVFL